MKIHEQRYARLLTHALFAYDMAQLLAERFDLGTVDRQSLRPRSTDSTRKPNTEGITNHTWTFDTELQCNVMMIVVAQHARQCPPMLHLLRDVVDRLVEVQENPWFRGQNHGLPPVVSGVLHTGSERWRMPSLHDLCSPMTRTLMQFDFPLAYFDVLHMDRNHDPDQPLLRIIFDIERCRNLDETIPVMTAIRSLEDREACELLMRFLSGKIRQWDHLRDEQGRLLMEAGRLDDSRPLAEVEREMERVQQNWRDIRPLAEVEKEIDRMQQHWFRMMDEKRNEGRMEGLLASFQRALAMSNLDSWLVESVSAHVDRIIEAARRGVQFDLENIPDGAQLIATIQEGGGPAQVSSAQIWDLLPHILEDDHGQH